MRSTETARCGGPSSDSVSPWRRVGGWTRGDGAIEQHPALAQARKHIMKSQTRKPLKLDRMTIRILTEFGNVIGGLKPNTTETDFCKSVDVNQGPCP